MKWYYQTRIIILKSVAHFKNISTACLLKFAFSNLTIFVGENFELTKKLEFLSSNSNEVQNKSLNFQIREI